MNHFRSDNNSLPKLVYIGEVPVESSYHGSALLYRLLQRYPADRLRVIEVMHKSQPARRLPGVEYCLYRPFLFRLLSTRLHDVAEPAASLLAPRISGDLVRRCMVNFQPEAVLTVAHNLGWMVAAALARRNGLPLHLIVHDDWPGFAWKTGLVNEFIAKYFAKSYKAAASRLCVSPYMVDEYEKRYGVTGTVLFPSRAANAAVFNDPPASPQDCRPFTIGYAGTLYPDHARTLLGVARELARIGGRLLLFGPFDPVQLTRFGLDMSNVECGGLVPSEELIRRLRDQADVLLVPMSFSDGEREAGRLNFPSKLADYTRAGLPLFIVGPSDSSAVRWALSNPGVAEVVQSRDAELLIVATFRLANDPAYRYQLALGAIEIGNRYFSHDNAESTLFAQLLTTRDQEHIH
jgi:glycosyltransferase involved in cell wall biosynthesis